MYAPLVYAYTGTEPRSDMYYKGRYLNDVRKIFGFLDPLPPCHCPIHATYQYYCHVLTNPPPSPSVRTSFKYRPQLQNLGLFMCVVAY